MCYTVRYTWCHVAVEEVDTARRSGACAKEGHTSGEYTEAREHVGKESVGGPAYLVYRSKRRVEDLRNQGPEKAVSLL